MPPIPIGKTNPHYREWVRLLRSAGRKRSSLFLIEGEREVLRALTAKVPLEAMIFSETALSSGKEKLFSDASQSEPSYSKEVRMYVLSDALFRTLSLREHPDGILAIAKRFEKSCDMLKLKADGLYILTEGLEKPGNLGALLRSAEAVAVDSLLLADPQTDVFNPNVIRASQGAVFEVKIYMDTSERFLEKIRTSGFPLYAATPHATRSFWECDFTQGGVFCIGNEARGLSDFWLKEATAIRIPMYGQSADSLNAAVAGTLLLYEARRQRAALS
jgi:TrmH family RNA methyltransferase